LCRACPTNVTQRGNRREPVFFEIDDYRPFSPGGRHGGGASARPYGPIA